LPKLPMTRLPLAQDQPGGGHVQGQPVEGHDQQQRREAGELQRLLEIERHHQDHHAEGDVEGDQQIQDVGIDRQDHQADHGHHRQRAQDVGVGQDQIPVDAHALRQ